VGVIHITFINLPIRSIIGEIICSQFTFMPPDNNINSSPRHSFAKDFFRVVVIIVFIVLVAFLISYFFFSKPEPDQRPTGLTEEERQAFLNQEIDESAVGLTDAEKQAFFEAVITNE